MFSASKVDKYIPESRNTNLELTPKVLDDTSRSIEMKEIKPIGRKLGLDDDNIDSIEKRYMTSGKEVIYRTLKCASTNTSPDDLIAVLRECNQEGAISVIAHSQCELYECHNTTIKQWLAFHLVNIYTKQSTLTLDGYFLMLYLHCKIKESNFKCPLLIIIEMCQKQKIIN